MNGSLIDIEAERRKRRIAEEERKKLFAHYDEERNFIRLPTLLLVIGFEALLVYGFITALEFFYNGGMPE